MLDGSDFGDGVLGALPQVIGSTIGNAVAAGVQRAGMPRSGRAQNSIAGSAATSADDVAVTLDTGREPDVLDRVTLMGGNQWASNSDINKMDQDYINYYNEKVGLTDLAASDYADADGFGNTLTKAGRERVGWLKSLKADVPVESDMIGDPTNLLLGAPVLKLAGLATKGVLATISAGAIKAAGRAEMASITSGSVGGIKTTEGILYNGLTGSGPLGSKVAGTFRSGSYTEITTSETTPLYRVYGGKADQVGPYWTHTQPSGPLQSMIDSALDPAWGNNASKVIRIDVPRGVKIYNGTAAAQRGLVGGGNQVFVPNIDKSWIVR